MHAYVFRTPAGPGRGWRPVWPGGWARPRAEEQPVTVALATRPPVPPCFGPGSRSWAERAQSWPVTIYPVTALPSARWVATRAVVRLGQSRGAAEAPALQVTHPWARTAALFPRSPLLPAAPTPSRLTTTTARASTTDCRARCSAPCSSPATCAGRGRSRCCWSWPAPSRP